MQAARDGREAVVIEWKRYLSGPNKRRRAKKFNALDADGYAAMHYAAKFNRLKIMKLLITCGAGISIYFRFLLQLFNN